MLSRSLFGLLLMASVQLSWAGWHLSYNGLSCQLTQTVTLESTENSTQQRLKIQFTVNEIGMNFLASTRADTPLAMLFIADNEILPESDHRFKLEHSDARELFIMLRDFASGRKRPIGIEAESAQGVSLTGNFQAENLLMPFQRSKPCINNLTAAIQRL